MKYSAATLALLAGLVAAQNPFGDAVPDCAAKCVVDGITAIGCTVEDTACACTTENLAKLASNPALVTCLTTSCTDPADLGKAAQAGNVLCAGAGGASSSEAPPASSSEAPTATDDATASASESGEASATSEPAVPTGGASNSTATGTGSGRPTPSKSSGGSEETGSGSGDGNGSGTSGAVANAAFGGVAFLAALLAL